MPTAAASPPTNRVEGERSDLFWDELTYIGTDGGFRYASIAEMTNAVHLVVTGRVVGIDRGTFHPYEANPLEGVSPQAYDVMLLVIEVDEVLKGEPVERAPGLLQIRLPGGDPEVLEANIPTHEHLFFLMNDGQWRLDLGYRLWDEETERMTYVRPNPFQSVIRNIDGLVNVIRPYHPDGESADYWPLELDGVLYADVLDEVRRAADQ